ncbi:MAG: enoyl-CoA hydratase/isomerase family protein [Ignavibacteria bacterium]|nr:enoyl-CoA hydratase/isomerase family protein [Ignavibacteria bacterium]
MEGYVKRKIENQVGIVTFFHPKSNSLPRVLLSQLEETIQSLANEDEVRVILLRSDGEKAFCAGASFDELSSLKEFDRAKDFFSGFGRLINVMRKAPKFIVGRIHNKIVGGGLGIVAACDYVVASTKASARLSEFSIGIGPFVISSAVERKIGKSAFMQMTIDTEWYDAKWCYEKGLYNRIFETEEAMDDYLNEFLKTLVSRSVAAQKQLKKLFWEDATSWDFMLFEKAEISATLALSREAQQIIQSFLTKSN